MRSYSSTVKFNFVCAVVFRYTEPNAERGMLQTYELGTLLGVKVTYASYLNPVSSICVYRCIATLHESIFSENTNAIGGCLATRLETKRNGFHTGRCRG